METKTNWKYNILYSLQLILIYRLSRQVYIIAKCRCSLLHALCIPRETTRLPSIISLIVHLCSRCEQLPSHLSPSWRTYLSVDIISDYQMALNKLAIDSVDLSNKRVLIRYPILIILLLLHMYDLETEVKRTQLTWTCWLCCNRTRLFDSLTMPCLARRKQLELLLLEDLRRSQLTRQWQIMTQYVIVLRLETCRPSKPVPVGSHLGLILGVLRRTFGFWKPSSQLVVSEKVWSKLSNGSFAGRSVSALTCKYIEICKESNCISCHLEFV